jgi:hypothetical protein
VSSKLGWTPEENSNSRIRTMPPSKISCFRQFRRIVHNVHTVVYSITAVQNTIFSYILAESCEYITVYYIVYLLHFLKRLLVIQLEILFSRLKHVEIVCPFIFIWLWPAQLANFLHFSPRKNEVEASCLRPTPIIFISYIHHISYYLA